MADTVLLFGTNTFTRHLIDWEREDCEYWCWNEIGSLKDTRPGYWAKRIDLLIQIHATPIWRNAKNLNDNKHYEWLQQPHEYPVYMQDHYEDVPSSVKYPKEEIVKALLPNIWREVNGKVDQVENFTSSTAYALALAIFQGKKRIELAGIEMTSDTEYIRQRPGVYFWLGIAAGRLIDVVIHSPLLMKEKPYGYTGEVVIHRQEFEMSCRKLDEIVEEAKTQVFEAKGRSQALLDALLKTSSQSDAARILPEFLSALNTAQDYAFRYGEMAGRYQENARYMKECDELIQAAGGEKALQVLMNVEAE